MAGDLNSVESKVINAMIGSNQSDLGDIIRAQMSAAGFQRGIIGLSGGLDSAVTTYLAVAALGSENVTGLMMPYETNDPECLEHAQLVTQQLGIAGEVIDIAPQIEAYFARCPEADPRTARTKR